jgi:hypothetical protein
LRYTSGVAARQTTAAAGITTPVTAGPFGSSARSLRPAGGQAGPLPR